MCCLRTTCADLGSISTDWKTTSADNHPSQITRFYEQRQRITSQSTRVPSKHEWHVRTYPSRRRNMRGAAGSSWVRSQGLTGVLPIPSKNPTACLGNDIHEHSGSYDLPSEQYTRTLAKKTSTSLQRHLCLLFRLFHILCKAALRFSITALLVDVQLHLQLLENLPTT